MKTKYEELGFRCGLEIHQQLEGKKLFCNCATLNSDKEADTKIERKLRAVAGETGVVDIAAEYEMTKNKKFFYQSNSCDTCLVEYDEEPPHMLNKTALETALKVSLLLNAAIVDEIQIMRKTVIDGSNVSGFQRTALVAMSGFVETSHGRIEIPTICLEEESAQKLDEGKDFVRYKLDRLGIPLLEIATSPDIKSPEEAKEVAAHIGMVLRSVENVKRGLGTIRQDVNVSIKDTGRVEIKGFQDLRSIPKVIEYEITRQLEIAKKGQKLTNEVRKAEPDFTTSYLRPIPSAARMYPETDVLPTTIKKDYVVKLKKSLPKLKSEKLGDFSLKYNISKEHAKELIDNSDFEYLQGKFSGKDVSVIIRMLLNTPNEIKSKLNSKDFEEILNYYFDGKIAKEAMAHLLESKSKGEKIDLSRFEGVSDDNLETEIKKIIEEKPNLNASAYMGLAMAKFRGKADGKKIMELVKKHSK
ncbi:MAG TPA: Glu-tRNA(Gln) amidotransferase subunit GatE [Candidatus Nanoarchaeia archaeon]|nr:Glu-tRNA(Gln) amidotransferase subunit GatE [Candidatus Nanoarchaeia archaeon]